MRACWFCYELFFTSWCLLSRSFRLPCSVCVYLFHPSPISSSPELPQIFRGRQVSQRKDLVYMDEKELRSSTQVFQPEQRKIALHSTPAPEFGFWVELKCLCNGLVLNLDDLSKVVSGKFSMLVNKKSRGQVKKLEFLGTGKGLRMWNENWRNLMLRLNFECSFVSLCSPCHYCPAKHFLPYSCGVSNWISNSFLDLSEKEIFLSHTQIFREIFFQYSSFFVIQMNCGS